MSDKVAGGENSQVLRPEDAQQWAEHCKSELIRKALLAATGQGSDGLATVDDSILEAETALRENAVIRKYCEKESLELLKKAYRAQEAERQEAEAARIVAEKATQEAEEEAAEKAAQRAAKAAAEEAARKADEAAKIAHADEIARKVRATKATQATKAAQTARAAKFARRAVRRGRSRRIRRRFNVRFAVILSAAAASLLAGIYFLHEYQLRRTAKVMLHKAEVAQQDGDMEEAQRFYTYYVNYVPDDAATYSKLAMLIADQAEAHSNRRAYLRAFFMLEQAARGDTTNLEVLRRLADYSIRIGRFPDAVEHLTRLIKRFPNDAELQLKLGQCRVATEHYPEAVACFQQVIGAEPSNVDAYMALADLFHDGMDDADQAEAVMSQMVNTNPKSSQAYLGRGRYWQKVKETEKAKEDIFQALEMAPNDMDILLAAAELAIGEKDFEKSREHLDRARELFPDNEQVYQTLAVLNVTMGKTDEAIEHLQEVLEHKKEDPRAMLSLADLQLKKGDLGAARHTVEMMQTAGYRPELLRFFNARIQVAEGKWREASYALQRLRASIESWPELATQADLLLGLCYEQLHLPDLQLASYRRVLIKNRGLVAARLGLASGLLRTGNLNAAAKEYRLLEEAMGSDKFLKVAALRNNRFQLIVSRIGALPEEDRDWSELEQFIERIEEVEGVDRVEKTWMRAELLAKTGKLKEARKLVATECEKQPKRMELWTASAQLAAIEEGPEAALKVLEVQKRLGNSLALRLFRARVAVRLEPAQGKKILAAQDSKLNKLSKAEKTRLWRALGAAHYRLRDRWKAKEYWQRVAKAQVEDARIRLTLFELAREANDEAGMREATDAIKELLGRRSAQWFYCEASQLVWKIRNEGADKKSLGPFNFKTAKQLLANAVQERPNWHELARLQGEIALLEGKLDDAIGRFQLASDLGPLSPVHLGQLVRLLYFRGRYEEAKQAIGKLRYGQTSLTMRKMEAELSFLTGDFDRALELAATTVAKSDRVEDFLWYGQLLARTKKNDQALEAFRKALELNPKIPETYLALVALLAGAGKKAEAQEIILQAQTRLSADHIPLVLAQSYQILKDFKRAEQYYREIVSLNPDDVSVLRRVARFYLQTGRKDEATKHLDKILKLAAKQPKAHADELIWARRSLARLVTARSDYRQLRRGLKLLDQNTRDGKIQLEDLRLKAAILASWNDRASRQKTISIFEEIREQRRGTLTFQEQFALARMYDKSGRWGLCKREMLELLAKSPENLLFLSTYAQMLLRNDQESAIARTYVNKLEKLQPKHPTTVGTKARLLVKEGKTEEAVELLGSLVPRPLPPDKVDWLRNVAQLLDELKLHDEAKKLLTEYAEKAPGGSLALASFLAHHGTLDEALDQCEAALGETPTDNVIATAVSISRIVGTGKIKPQHLSRMEKWFERAKQENPDSKTLQLNLAALRDLQNRQADVLKVYRGFLARKDVSDRERAVVWNNLAFMLAADKKNGQEALKMINYSISILGPSPELLDTRALALLATGRSEAAIKDLRAAIAQRPSGMNYFHLALAHLAANDQYSAARVMKVAHEAHRLTISQIPQIERNKYQQLTAQLAAAGLDYGFGKSKKKRRSSKKPR